MGVTRFLFDSGIASDYLNHRRGVFERARIEVAQGNRIGIGVPVLAELIAGIEHSKSRDRSMQLLKSALATLKLWPFDPPAASSMAESMPNSHAPVVPCRSST